MSRLPEQPFGALVGHSDDRRGRSRSRDPPAALVGPQAPYRNDWQVYQESPRSRKGILKRLRASDVGHEYGGAVGQIAEGVANGEAEKAWAGGNRWSPTTKSF